MTNFIAKTVFSVAISAACLAPGLVEAQATLQFFHAAADTNILDTDVWMDNVKMLSNFSYLHSIRSITVPSGVDIQIRVKRPGSLDTANPLIFKRYNFEPDKHYVVIATGKIGNNVPPQPDGIPCEFDLGLVTWTRITSLEPHSTGYRFFNSVIDASSLSINIAGTSSNLLPLTQYGTGSNYVAIPSFFLQIDCNDSRGFLVHGYDIGAYGNDDSLITIVATGFEAPIWQSLRPFQLYGIMRGGRTFPLVPHAVTNVKSFGQMSVRMYPNPASQGLATIVAEAADDQPYDVVVMDCIGRRIYQTSSVLAGSGTHLNLQALPKGLYTVQVTDQQHNTAQCRLEN